MAARKLKLTRAGTARARDIANTAAFRGGGNIIVDDRRKRTTGGARGRKVTTTRKVTLRVGRTGAAPARRGTIKVAGQSSLMRRKERLSGTQKAFMRTGNQRTPYSMRVGRRGVSVAARQG